MGFDFKNEQRRPDPLLSALYWVAIILGIIFLVFSFTNFADARVNTDIGITLSKTCITMIKNNITSNCPTYEQILALYPDTSNQNISGKFIFEDNYYHRGNTNFKSHFGFYTYEPNTFWVDPPGDIVGKIATITIEPRLPDYKISETKNYINNTLTVGHSVWVDDLCYRATIGADDWILRTGQVIYFMDNNCNEEYKTFDNVRSVKFEKTYQDITTSYKYQLDKWLADIRINCKGLCFEY